MRREGEGALRGALAGALRGGLPAHPRRRQLAGARDALGRAHASALHRPRAGRLGRGCRRQPLRRPRRLVGPDDPRPCRSRRADDPQGDRGARHQLRGADRARDRARLRGQGRDALDRARALRQLGHRGRDVGGPPRARRHRPQQDPQVRRLLPRPRRRPARRGRLGARDARHPRLARRAARDDRRHPDGALQRSGERARGDRALGRRARVHHRRARAREHGLRPARARLPRGPARGVRRLRRAAGVRRGHDRLPRRTRRRAGALRRSRPTSPCSGRSWAAGCPRPRSAAGAT